MPPSLPCRSSLSLPYRMFTSSVYSAPEDQSIYVDVDTRIQVLDTILHLPNAEKDQCAAFIVRRQERSCCPTDHLA